MTRSSTAGRTSTPLGVTLHLLATGRSPDGAGTVPDLLAELADRKSDPFRKELAWAWPAKVPLQMAVVIMGLMATAPEDCSPTARPVLAELDAIELVDDVTG